METRVFWPAARRDRPKTPVQPQRADQSARRIFVLVPAVHEEILSAAIEGRIPGAKLLLEPERRGTAVAIA